MIEKVKSFFVRIFGKKDKLKYFRLIYCPMCWASHYPLIRFENGHFILDMDKVIEFYRKISDRGPTHVRFVYQCFGDKTKLKETLLPWQMTVAGKVCLAKKNQEYFDIAKKFFIYLKSIGLKIWFNPLNNCERPADRWKNSPWNKLNNVEGVDGFEDPKAAGLVSQYVGWLIADLGDLIDVWQPVNEANKNHLEVIELIALKLKAHGITADHIAYSICLNLDNGEQNHLELMMYRDKIFDGVQMDAMDRCNHGLAKDPQGRFYDVLAGVKSWVFLPSDDGGDRETMTPEKFAKLTKDGLEHFGLANIQLGPDRLNRLRLGGIEGMITSDIKKDIAKQDAAAKVIEKFFGEKLPNRGKYPPLPPPPDPPDPEPPTPPEPEPEPEPEPLPKPKIKITWQGWLGLLIILIVLAILIF